MMRRGVCTVVFDDGETIQVQGAIRVEKDRTHSQVDFSDGSKRDFELRMSKITVVEKDGAYDYMQENGGVLWQRTT